MAVNANERKNFVKLDTTKLNALYEIAKGKGLNATTLNRSIGHTEGFLKQCEYNGYIKKSDVILVNMMYGIDLELKEVVKEEKAETPDNETLESLMRKISANNVILKTHSEDIAEIKSEIHDIAVSLRTIGNLLTQINEKIYERNKE